MGGHWTAVFHGISGLSRSVVVVTVACVAGSAVVSLMCRPAPTLLPTAVQGDAQLAALARGVVGEDQPALAVACVTTRVTRTASIGAAPTDRFEIGSISKGLTGLLFAEMIDRGEVRADTPLGDLLPVTGALADVRLSQLATHTSGLPAQLPTVGQLVRNAWASLTAGNPYDSTVAELLDRVDGIALDAAPGTYSNLGFELLGAALGAAADRPYRELLHDRVLHPVGLTEAIVPYAESELTSRDLGGETAGGRTSDPWLGEAIAPAGGVRADIGQLAVLGHRLLTERAPGLDALQPQVTERGRATGWAWITMPSPVDQRPIVWHNGGTGGFSSFLGLDRDRGVAVVVLAATGGSPGQLTRAGFELLHEIGSCA